MTIVMLLAGVVIALAIISSIPKIKSSSLQVAAGVAAIFVLFIFFTLSSVRYVGPDEVGVVVKDIGTKSLSEGEIIATDGEKGPQARTLAPGWHPWLWPGIYKVETPSVVEIGEDEVGLIKTTDGAPLPEGVAFAPEWEEATFQQMLQAEYFLENGGFKGPQTSALRPGTYRLNPRLYEVEKIKVTNIPQATVGVIKSNVGPRQRAESGTDSRLVNVGSRGIWNEAYPPSKLYLNTRAYEITLISNAKRVVRFTKSDASGEEREIIVRSSDGFTFPVDVRIEYEVEPQNAPLLVARLGGDDAALREVLNSAVRAIFRNNAEGVKALDYVRQRSQQESQSLGMLAEEMRKVGVTISAVRIGDVGDEQTLGALLKTQTDREIALQEQLTFQEQQRAAEQKKALTRTEQEAEEEKRLATAQYEVKIAEEAKQQRIIAAQAEAEAIRIQADAQAQAFQMIAQQIGRGNSAMIEMLKVVGERGIQITPRVMVAGQNGESSADMQTTALIGTMLDRMVQQDDN
ncbi:MAG: SPFH domain-containing protein [Planctomycetota bacterium]|nr:SPFH domain-containing protein [Planctomycetota bacterium]